MSTSVLYFHGFASSPKGQKITRLREILGSEVVLDAPDMNVPSFEKLAFAEMMRLAEAEAARRPPDVIVGSSLGALVALELLQREVRAPVVLIAPAVGVGKRWRERFTGDPVRVFHHGANGEMPIHRAFFDEMNGVEPETRTPLAPVSIIMGREDESVTFSMVRGVWEEWTASGSLPKGSRFIEIAGGDHSLVAWVDVIAREIGFRGAER